MSRNSCRRSRSPQVKTYPIVGFPVIAEAHKDEAVLQNFRTNYKYTFRELPILSSMSNIFCEDSDMEPRPYISADFCKEVLHVVLRSVVAERAICMTKALNYERYEKSRFVIA